MGKANSVDQNKIDNLFINVKRLFSILSKKRKIQFGLIFFLNIFSSIAELFSLSALMPFLIILSSQNENFANGRFSFFYNVIINKGYDIKFIVTIIFIFSIIISSIIRYLTVYIQTKFSYSIGGDLLKNAYSNVLNQSYITHVNRNTSEVIATISNKIGSVIQAVIISILNLLNSIIVSSVIVIALFYIDKKMVLLTTTSFILIYFFLIKISKKNISIDSKTTSTETNKQIQILQEGLGGIRDIIITGTQEIYVNELSKSFSKLRNAQESIIIRGASPKYLIETFGMVLIALFAYFETINSEHNNVIPVIGALALGSLRILPLLQQAYSSFVSISGCNNNLEDVLKLLECENTTKARNKNQLSFERQIKFNKISFKYQENGPIILNNISLEIPKGSICGIIGKTGSGKSTFLDILMGLLKPSNGTILIDNVNIYEEPINLELWQNCISHVPQKIYLKDATLKENIAFGVPIESIDYDRLKISIEQAQLSTLVDSWAEKYDKFIGEGGGKLSGGQRQRIGIARALYLRSKLLVFDEATSALDLKTEEDVMKSIQNLSLDTTIIIIAHRIETLNKCDFIFEFNKGEVNLIGNYSDLSKKIKNELT